jgi:hypothetical protein
MAHTNNQGLESCLNALSYDFSTTQKEVKKNNANITTINSNMHSTINTKMKKLKQDMTKDLSAYMERHLPIQLESFIVQLFSKMHILGDLTSSDQPFHPDDDTYSYYQNFQSHRFQCDLCRPRVDAKKYDGSDPMG